MKIPAALEKAAAASLPVVACGGREDLRSFFMEVRGGSKSCPSCLGGLGGGGRGEGGAAAAAGTAAEAGGGRGEEGGGGGEDILGCCVVWFVCLVRSGD